MSRGRVRTFPPAALALAVRETLTLEAAASLVGCSPPLIQATAKQSPEVRAAISQQSHNRENILADSLSRHRGILSLVAVEVGLGSAAAVRYHVFRSPRLKQIFDDTREKIIDTAEDNVFRAVETGSVKDSWQLLKTLGKDRGYTERREVSGTVEHNITHAPSESLVALLDQLAANDPDAIEAEFSSLPEEDRALLKSSLSRFTPKETKLSNESPETLYHNVTEFVTESEAVS